MPWGRWGLGQEGPSARCAPPDRVVRLDEQTPFERYPLPASAKGGDRRRMPENFAGAHGDGTTDVIVTGKILMPDGSPAPNPQLQGVEYQFRGRPGLCASDFDHRDSPLEPAMAQLERGSFGSDLPVGNLDQLPKCVHVDVVRLAMYGIPLVRNRRRLLHARLRPGAPVRRRRRPLLVRRPASGEHRQADQHRNRHDPGPLRFHGIPLSQRVGELSSRGVCTLN